MKQSGYLTKIESRHQRELAEVELTTHRFTRQMMVDLSYIALNKAFGFGSERLQKYANALKDVYSEYADLWNADDADTEYSRATLDAKLKQIFGDDFHPWEVRYR